MATWTHSESSIFLDKDNTFETENGNICSDKPMDLKQVICNQEDTLSDWDTSKLVKTKAFRIKDILGLDENEKLMSTSTDGNNFNNLKKSSTITSNNSLNTQSVLNLSSNANILNATALFPSNLYNNKSPAMLSSSVTNAYANFMYANWIDLHSKMPDQTKYLFCLQGKCLNLYPIRHK